MGNAVNSFCGENVSFNTRKVNAFLNFGSIFGNSTLIYFYLVQIELVTWITIHVKLLGLRVVCGPF